MNENATLKNQTIQKHHFFYFDSLLVRVIATFIRSPLYQLQYSKLLYLDNPLLPSVVEANRKERLARGKIGRAPGRFLRFAIFSATPFGDVFFRSDSHLTDGKNLMKGYLSTAQPTPHSFPISALLHQHHEKKD